MWAVTSLAWGTRGWGSSALLYASSSPTMFTALLSPSHSQRRCRSRRAAAVSAPSPFRSRSISHSLSLCLSYPGLGCRTGRAPRAAAEALPAHRRPALAARASPRAAPGRSWRRRAAAAGRRRRGRSRAGAGGGSAARAAERRDAAGPGRRAGGAGRGAPGCAGLPAPGTGRDGTGLPSLLARRLLTDLAPLWPPSAAIPPASSELSRPLPPTLPCSLPPSSPFGTPPLIAACFPSPPGSDSPPKQPCSDLVP